MSVFKTIYFDLTEEHVKLIRQFNITWDGAYEGAPAVDSKRPFGNSDLECDICEILEIEPVEHDNMEDETIYPKGTSDRVMKLYAELELALQVVLTAGSFEPGRYEAEEYHSNWRKSEPEMVTLIVSK